MYVCVYLCLKYCTCICVYEYVSVNACVCVCVPQKSSGYVQHVCLSRMQCCFCCCRCCCVHLNPFSLNYMFLFSTHVTDQIFTLFLFSLHLLSWSERGISWCSVGGKRLAFPFLCVSVWWWWWNVYPNIMLWKKTAISSSIPRTQNKKDKHLHNFLFHTGVLFSVKFIITDSKSLCNTSPTLRLKLSVF